MHPAQEIKAFARNLGAISKDLYKLTGIIMTVLLMTFLLRDRLKDSGRELIAFWPILVPAIAVFLMYALVTWQDRYASGETVVIWGAILASTTIAGDEWKTQVLRAASLMLGAVVICSVPLTLIKTYRDTGRYGSVSPEPVMTAERLRTMGIESRDRVALIGDGIEAYWARLDKVRIVAEAPQDLETGDAAAAFWNSSPQTEQAVLSLLKSTGAKAVIANTPPAVLPPGWVPAGDTGRAVYFFR
jgi:hypothetical protein